MSRLSPAQLAADLQGLIAGGWLSDADPAVVVHDQGHFAARLASLMAAFPSGTLHTLAIKANPLVPILRQAVEAGLGLEAASIEEVYLAIAAGCAPERIVYDSPAKSVPDLREALGRGVRINADSLEELARIAAAPERAASASVVGIRLRANVGAGTIAATSVGHAGSRFGAALTDEALVETFKEYPWLVGLHGHVGSQGCSLDQLMAGAAGLERARGVVDGALGAGRVRVLDLGGGLPVAYVEGVEAPSFADYAARLRREVPALMAAGSTLVTEFGRALLAGSGWAASRVEYVKEVGDGRVAVIHLGADMFMRTAYRPEDWPHEFLVMDPEGRLKSTPDARPCSIAGPLCFAGDVIGRNLRLPAIAPGDVVVVRDAGAYAMGMWSRHCSRRRPAVIGRAAGDQPHFHELVPRESLAQLVASWGGRLP